MRKWRTVGTHQMAAFFCEKCHGPHVENYDVMSEIWLRQSMRIYLKNNPANFHLDMIWNDRALGFFEDDHPNKKNWVSE